MLTAAQQSKVLRSSLAEDRNRETLHRMFASRERERDGRKREGRKREREGEGKRQKVAGGM